MQQIAKLLGTIMLIKGHLRLFGIRIRREAQLNNVIYIKVCQWLKGQKVILQFQDKRFFARFNVIDI